MRPSFSSTSDNFCQIAVTASESQCCWIHPPRWRVVSTFRSEGGQFDGRTLRIYQCHRIPNTPQHTQIAFFTWKFNHNELQTRALLGSCRVLGRLGSSTTGDHRVSLDLRQREKIILQNHLDVFFSSEYLCMFPISDFLSLSPTHWLKIALWHPCSIGAVIVAVSTAHFMTPGDERPRDRTFLCTWVAKWECKTEIARLIRPRSIWSLIYFFLASSGASVICITHWYIRYILFPPFSSRQWGLSYASSSYEYIIVQRWKKKKKKKNKITLFLV